MLQIIGIPRGWNLEGMTGGKEQYWACSRKSIRIQMPSGLDGVVNPFLFLVE